MQSQYTVNNFQGIPAARRTVSVELIYLSAAPRTYKVESFVNLMTSIDVASACGAIDVVSVS